MAESITDIAVKMGIDADGVAAGLNFARTKVVDFTKFMQQQMDAHVDMYRQQTQAAINALNQFNTSRIGTSMDPYRSGDARNAAAMRFHAMRERDAQNDKDAANSARNLAEARRELQRITERNISAEERYQLQLANLRSLSHTLVQGGVRQALVDKEMGREKTRLTIDLIRFQQAQRGANAALQQGADTTRIMTGVLAQASFAAEDFIQGMVFGDIRSAMLGASNNLTMVVRGLMQASSAGSTLGGTLLTIGGALTAIASGAGALIALDRWINQVQEDTRSLSQVMSDVEKQFRFENIDLDLKAEDRRFKLHVENMTDVKQALKEEQKLRADLATAQERYAQQEEERIRKGKEGVTALLGGQQAMIELENRLAEYRRGDAEDQALAKRVQRSIDLAIEAYGRGAGQQVMDELSRVFDDLNNESWFYDMTSTNKLDELFDIGEVKQLENIKAIRDNVNLINELGTEQIKQLKEQEQLQRHINQLVEERIRLANLEQPGGLANLMGGMFGGMNFGGVAFGIDQTAFMLKQVREDAARAENQAAMDKRANERAELVYLAQATEAQKRLLDLHKQINELMTPTAANPMVGVGGLAGAMQVGVDAAAAMALVNGRIKQLEQELSDSSAGKVTAQGALLENAFAAQGKAFEQMYNISSEKPNRQLEQIRQELAMLRQAQQNPAVLKVIP